jgi:hypothetical protein
MLFRSLVVAAALALGACSSTGPAFARLEHPPALAAQHLELRLTDERPSVSSSVSVPDWTLPGNGQELSPPLDPGLQTALEFTLRKHLVPAARDLRVEVRVLKGLASWSGSWVSESEKGSAQVSVSVFDVAGNRLLVSGTGESWAEHSSFDTSEERVIRILGTAVQAAALEFLASEPARAALAGT